MEPTALQADNAVAIKYEKMAHYDHILKRPDTYLGSTEIQVEAKGQYLFDSVSGRMQWHNTVSSVPALLRIFDEPLVNASDNRQRDPLMSCIRVTVNTKTNTISIFNTGKPIPIVMHPKENVWVIELIFGHLLTGSNYDDTVLRYTGGRNGYERPDFILN